MNDISQRLRESAKATFYDPLKSELNEAASHIEKLEAALLALKLTSVDPVSVAIAVEALEGKND